MRVLVLNSGSSSLKFRLLDVLEGGPQRELKPGHTLVSGAAKGIG
jgi:acetate kinase